MNRIAREIGPYTANTDDKPVIMCHDRDFFEDQQTGLWYEPGFPAMQGLRFPASHSRPCAEWIAFTFRTGVVNSPRTNHPGPSTAIVLCDRWNSGALNRFATIGANWRTIAWKSVPLNFLTFYMSKIILHEFMHAMDPDRCKTFDS